MCSAQVNPDQLASGLAVRVSGEVVCAHCIDLLPTDAKVRINQLRALRGQAATPYRYRHPRFPDLRAYTFATSAQVIRHHRLRNEGKELEAPEIAPRSAASPPPPHPPQATPGNRRRLWIFAGIGSALVAVLLLVTIAALAGGGDDPRATDPDPVARAVTSEIDTAGATRGDYPRQASEAWPVAAAELPIDHPVLAAIAEELGTQREHQLDLAERAIAEDELIKAGDLLDRMHWQPHVLLRSLERREQRLRVALDDALASRVPPEPADPQPEPEPEPPTVVIEQPRPEVPVPPPTPEAPPEPVDATPPALAAQTPAETPEPTPSEPAPSEPVTPPPTQPPPPPVLVAPAGGMIAGQAADGDWEAHDGVLVLANSTGIASRPVRVPEGPLRLWLELEPELPEQTILIARLGEQQLRATAEEPGWVAFDPPADPGAGTALLEILARGTGLRVGRIALAPPAVDVASAEASGGLDWVDAPAPEDVVVREIAPDFGDQVLDAFIPGSQVPELPGGVDQFVGRSVIERRSKRHALTVPLGEIDLRDGGVALLVHAFEDLERAELTTTLVDARRREIATQPVVFTGDSWHTVLLSVPAGEPAGFDPGAVDRLILRDVSQRTVRPFLVAKVVAVTGRPPTAEDLGITPRALRMADPVATEALLDRIADQRRTRRDWRDVLKIDKLRILAGHQLVTGSWQTQVYDRLEQQRGERPKRGTVAPLMMHNPWLDETFIIPSIITDTAQDIVVVATAGVEFPTGLTVDQALENFWLKMIEETLASGILPVPVLGPTKVVPEQQDQADELWSRLDTALRKHHPDLPVIDLRPVGRAHFARFGPGQAQQCATMLADAVDELQVRLRLLHDADPGRR